MKKRADEEKAQLKKQIETLDEQAEKLQTETVRVRKDLEGSIATLRTEKVGLVAKLDSLEHQLHSKDDTFSKSMADLNVQAASLATAKANLEEETAKRTALEKDMAATRDQLDELRTSAAADKKKYQLQVDSLEAEKASMDKEVKETQAGWTQTKEEIKDLEEKQKEAEVTWVARVQQLEAEKTTWNAKMSHSVVWLSLLSKYLCGNLLML